MRGDTPALHTGGRAFQSGAVSDNLGGAILASVAAADMDRDGAPEVVATDMEGKVYAWDDAGNRLWTRESNIDYSGKPLQPFEDVRYVRSNPDESKRRRTQHGFVGSPVLVDLDSNDGGRLEIVAAAMDRHVYAWNDDGSPVPGFPVLVVDQTKVASVDPQTHAVTFNSNAGEALNQGAIIDTPAVGDLTGDGHARDRGRHQRGVRDEPGQRGPAQLLDVQRRDRRAARPGGRHPLRRTTPLRASPRRTGACSRSTPRARPTPAVPSCPAGR